MNIRDLTGQRFGRLLVLEKTENSKGKSVWKCKCDCGTDAFVRTSDLKNGHTKSCGCYQREMTSKASKKHGLRHTKIYHTWLDMKDRCFNSKNKRFSTYGGRGITVCDEWRNSFEAFYEWAMVNGYSGNLTIERIDVNGNYEPSNCKWITMPEQAKNKTNSIYIEFEGEIKTISEWSSIKNIKYATLLYRYHAGFSVEKIFYKGRLQNGIDN